MSAENELPKVRDVEKVARRLPAILRALRALRDAIRGKR
jgi:hypothetical protein